VIATAAVAASRFTAALCLGFALRTHNITLAARVVYADLQSDARLISADMALRLTHEAFPLSGEAAISSLAVLQPLKEGRGNFVRPLGREVVNFSSPPPYPVV
jgi:hypothetical protein